MTQGAATAFQAENAEHVADADVRDEVAVPQCFQDEESEHSPITSPGAEGIAGPLPRR